MSEDTRDNHDDRDREEDPVAVETADQLSDPPIAGGGRSAYNNWGSLWIVCTGTCTILSKYSCVVRAGLSKQWVRRRSGMIVVQL